MSIRYKVVQCHLKDSRLNGKRFGKAVSLGTVTTRQLAEEEISHSTAVTRSDIVAVLIELFNVLMAYLLNPMAVRLDEAGSFRTGFKWLDDVGSFSTGFKWLDEAGSFVTIQFRPSCNQTKNPEVIPGIFCIGMAEVV